MAAWKPPHLFQKRKQKRATKKKAGLLREFPYPRIKKYLPIIGVFLFIYICSKINLFELIQLFKGVKASYIIFALLLNCIVFFIKTLKWKELIKGSNLDFSFKESLQAFSKSQFWGFVTPGKIGDLTRIKYLRERTHASIGIVSVTVLLDRVFDIGILISFCFFASLILANIFNTKILLNLTLSLFILFTFLIIILTKREYGKIILKPFCLIAFKQFKFDLTRVLKEFYQGVDNIRLSHYVKSIAQGLVAWILFYISFYVISLAISLKLPFWVVVASAPLACLISILPISIAGLGTREAFYLWIFGNLGVDIESIVAFSVLIFLITNASYSLPGLFIYLFKGIQRQNH